MTREPVFRCADIAMLRAPVHPAAQASRRWVAGPAFDDAAPPNGLVVDLAADPLVREAISISSPTLSHRLDVLLSAARSQDRPAAADVRRTVRALTSYRLRMSSRSTPFGLMAGVARVDIVDDPADAKVRFGTGHRRHARPDLEWLTEVIRDCERRPEVLAGLRVVRNSLCFPRGDRLVLPYLPGSSESKRARTAVQEISVRRTAAVRAVEDLAGVPIRFGDLAARVAGAFPTVRRDIVEAALRQLVAKEILLTELRPGMDATDPLEHVIDVLAAVPSAPGELARQLDALRSDLTAYATQPLGEGRPALGLVHERMRRLSAEQPLVQVDLALDADVALPRAVAAEAERVADLLWRLSPTPPGTAALRQYHTDFLERYGPGRLVAIKELLDPDIGLGAPAGYRIPPSPRFVRPEPEEQDTTRDRMLAALVQEATLTGQPEIELADGHPLLTRFSSDEGRCPPSLDLHTHLLASSTTALQNGHFRLVVLGGLGHAGASFGRFAYLFDDETRDAFGAVARGGVTTDPAISPVQLVYQVRSPRGGNVTQVPRWAPRTLPVAAFAAMDDPSVLRLDDLAVGADAHRMYVVDVTTGTVCAPTTFHLLNAHNESPNAARFLREIDAVGMRRWGPWNWGRAAVLPYTPRIRNGRSILALARWRPPEQLREQAAPFAAWAGELAAWRDRWRVPQRVCLTYADQRIDLDLGDPLQQWLLRYELGRRAGLVTLSETVADAGPGTGWLTATDGVHRNEMVFPLVAAPTAPRPTRRCLSIRPVTGRHLPGGEWLYASVYCSAGRSGDILTTVPDLAAGLDVDRWFFLRYGDPDHHLRLRFHGSPAVLTAQLLPRLSAWAAGLRDTGMARRLVLDTYDPELERYGGPSAIEAAERVFHADSVAVVEQLRLLASGVLALDPSLLAAANHVDLAVRFWDGVDGGTGWVSGTLARTSEHSVFQRQRALAMRLVDPHSDWAGLRGTPGGEAVLDAWARRGEAVNRYGRLIRDLGDRSWSPPGPVLTSLLHMHHNRLVGLDRDAERRSYALARGAVAAHLDRRRAQL